jgi:hypothetical protein
MRLGSEIFATEIEAGQALEALAALKNAGAGIGICESSQ